MSSSMSSPMSSPMSSKSSSTLEDMPTVPSHAPAMTPRKGTIQKGVSTEQPIDKALNVVGDRYSLAIVDRLYQHNVLRYGELESDIPGISPRTLSIRLKQLDEAGLITRQAFATKPPRVDYSLTEKGTELAIAAQRLAAWGETL